MCVRVCVYGGKERDMCRQVNHIISHTVTYIKKYTHTHTHKPSPTKQVLVATDVVSEGIDVPECSLVVVYDDLKNVTSFVQMRGRARKKEGGAFVVMVPPSRTAEEGIRALELTAEQFQNKRWLETAKVRI